MAGIYIHIPFCKKICFYCDFYKEFYTGSSDEYVTTVMKEAEMRRDYLGEEEISTIYIGGGTPSVLSCRNLEKILNGIRRLFRVNEKCEITIEINPDDVNEDYVKGIKKAGFNRISLGIQSWREEDLKFLNRRHDAKQAEKALELLLNTGISNISVDLIYGIPGMNIADWEKNLDITFGFDIKHLSAYHLTIEPGTVFGKRKKEGNLEEIDEEESVNQFNMLVEKALEMDFIHYEISNFGKKEYFSQHNANYWRQLSYIGLGPSAHSFNQYSRQWNVRNIKIYISQVKEEGSFFEKEELNIKTRFNEYVMTSLRTMWGINLDYIERTFDKEGYDYIVNLSQRFKDYGLMIQEGNNLQLTNQGKMISDNIISEFMMDDNN